MRMKKVLATALASLMAVSALAACSQTSSEAPTRSEDQSSSTVSTSVSEPEQTKEPVTINYLTSSMQYAKASSQINEELQKVYPYLTVNIEHIADNYEACLLYTSRCV